MFIRLFLITGILSMLVAPSVFAQGAGIEWDILHQEAINYTLAGKYDKAILVEKEALTIAENSVGPDSANVVFSLRQLAICYEAQDNYVKAELLYKRSLKIMEKGLGPNHSEVAKLLDSLAFNYVYQGEYSKAEPLFKRALTIRETIFGTDHPDIATSLGNVAFLYSEQGNYTRAEPLFKRSLEINEKNLGLEHHSVAIDLSSLALIYYSQGNLARAEPLLKRSLEIDEKNLGLNHLSLVGRLKGLAAIYNSQGNYTKAESLLKRSLEIMKNSSKNWGTLGFLIETRNDQDIFDLDDTNYLITFNKDGAILKKEGSTELINLDKNCDAYSKINGKGTWRITKSGSGLSIDFDNGDSLFTNENGYGIDDKWYYKMPNHGQECRYRPTQEMIPSNHCSSDPLLGDLNAEKFPPLAARLKKYGWKIIKDSINCSGTGMGYCRLEAQDCTGRTLYIETTEYPPRYINQWAISGPTGY